jgi:hypothetical protein
MRGSSLDEYTLSGVSITVEAGTQHAFRAQAYARPVALRTGFEWYRAFPQDEKDNQGDKGDLVQTAVLYLRGEHEAGDLERYLNGLRSGGLRNV